LAKQKVYSPNQVLAASFLGGPMAMVYVLWRNFQTMQNPHGMQQILLWGSLFIAALMLFAPLMTATWPDYVLPFAYSFAAWRLAQTYQMPKPVIAASEDFEFQSVGNVIAVSIVFLLAMMATAIILYSTMAAVGLI